jgi:hypothetical protein
LLLKDWLREQKWKKREVRRLHQSPGEKWCGLEVMVVRIERSRGNG